MRGPSRGEDTGWTHAVERSIAFKALLIGLYLTLNISLNMLNKWTLTLYGFRFPLLMSLSHMAFSFLALTPLMVMKSYRDMHAPTLQKQWFGILAIGTLFAVNVGFNNISLLTIPLSLNQVIRASIPVVAAIGSVFIEGKTPTRTELFSLVVLCVGVAVAVWEGSDTKASITGIALCLLGTVSNGLMMSSIGKLLSEKLDVLRLTFYTAPLTCVVLLPFYLHLEAGQYSEYKKTHTGGYMGLLILGCVNALMYNIIHALVIKVTSAVTTTVIGEMKIIMILVLSAMLLGESGIWTVKMLVGCTTAILGFCMYSHAKLGASAPSWQPIIKGVPELPLGREPSDPSRNPLLSRSGSHENAKP